MQDIMQQLGGLLVGAIPTALLFIVLVFAYQFLVQGPLTAVLARRRALTEGAMEDARKAVAQAEAKAQEYAERLRQARADVYKLREQRIKQWSAERDTALDAARKAASQKVRQAKAELEAEAASARQAIQASAADLAGLAVRAVLPLARCRGFPLKYSLAACACLASFFPLGFPVCRTDGPGRRVDRCPGHCALPRRRAAARSPPHLRTCAVCAPPQRRRPSPLRLPNRKKTRSEAFLHSSQRAIGGPPPAPQA